MEDNKNISLEKIENTEEMLDKIEEDETEDVIEEILNNRKKKTKRRQNKKNGKIKEFFKSRKTKKGSLAILLSVIFIVLIIGLNIVSSLLVDRFPSLSVDLTSKSVFELQSDTVKYVEKIKESITINVLQDEKSFESNDEYYVQANKLLKQFTQYNDNIKIKYVDLSKNPGFTTKYKDIDFSKSSYLLLVESKDEYRALSASDLFDYNQEYLSYYGQYVIESQHVEQAVVTAILNITTVDKTKVSFLSGQDEEDSSSLQKLLSDNAYSVEEISLLNKNIDKDCDFLVIYAPKVDIEDSLLEKLELWLDNKGNYGKTLIYFPNDQVSDRLPNFDNLLSKWGVEINDGIVFETDPNHMTNTVSPYLVTIVDYENDTYTKNLKTTDIPVVMLYTLPINITDSAVATPLLTTSDSAIIMPRDADENWDYTKEEKGKLNAATISTKSGSDSSSNLITIGSYESMTSSALKSTSYNNSAYILNIFNTISKTSDVSITIEGKNLDKEELGLTNTSSATVISIIVRFVLPIVILIIGLIVFFKRRHK